MRQHLFTRGSWRPHPRLSFHTASIQILNLSQAMLDQFKARARPFPLCLKLNKSDTQHTYTKKFAQSKVPGSQEWPSSRLLSCPSFLQLGPTDRRDTLINLGGYMRCAGFIHKQDDCKANPPRCRERDSDGITCGIQHLTELHGCDHSTVRILGPRFNGIDAPPLQGAR